LKKLFKIGLIVLVSIVVLTLTSGFLYRHFVGNRIMDGGRTENPDVYRADKELVEFSWYQNHMNYYSCFSLNFYLENDMPVADGWFLNYEDGEKRQSEEDAFLNPIPWQLTWVQWFELQNMLSELKLPEYQEPSPYVMDETDSKIYVVWRTKDGNITEKLSGNNANELKDLVFRIAEEAYVASQLEEQPYEVNETAKLTGFYCNQNAESENGWNCPSCGMNNGNSVFCVECGTKNPVND